MPIPATRYAPPESARIPSMISEAMLTASVTVGERSSGCRMRFTMAPPSPTTPTVMASISGLTAKATTRGSGCTMGLGSTHPVIRAWFGFQDQPEPRQFGHQRGDC